MTFGGNPFSTEGIRKGLSPGQAAAANEVGQQQRRIALDEAELRDLERAEYYGETPAVGTETVPATRPRKSIIDRILRR